MSGSFGGLASIIGLTVGGLFFNAVGNATFLISGGVIFAVFGMSFRLLRMKWNKMKLSRPEWIAN